MIPLGLSAAGKAALLDTLTTDHLVHVSVYLTNLNGAKLANLTDRLLDGQVNIDAEGDITRSCTLSLLDPERSIGIDSDSPNVGSLYFDRMIQVNYSVLGPPIKALGLSWLTIPLFTGPVVKPDRSDDVINVECQGKELLGMGQMWNPHTYAKGANKRNVIVDLLKYHAGETKFDFPEYSAQLPGNYPIGRMNTPWGVAKYVANGMGLQLFYDGRGTARLRARPQTSVYRFRTGDDGAVMTPPKLTPDLTKLKNLVWVHGSINPGGGLTAYQIGAVAQAPANHPLSAVRLGRHNGVSQVPRYLVEEIDNASVSNQGEAQRQADAILNARLLDATSVEFDSRVIPVLDELDVCRLDTDKYSSAFRFTKASIPLVARDDNHMTIGYQKPVSLRPRPGALQNMTPGKLQRMG